MKKILYTASRMSHIENFHIPYINYFLERGDVVHILTQGEGSLKVDKIYDVNFEKKITSFKNINSILEVKKILENEKYDLIITNTALSSLIVRIAKKISNVRKVGKVIYIVHGYLFSKNSKLLKKLMYILPEKLCKSVTDRLITMNKEDYELTDKYKIFDKEVLNIDGMGISQPLDYSVEIKNSTRLKYKVSDDEFLITYVGELSKRKNQLFLINSFPEIIKKFPNVKMIFAGNGDMYDIFKERISDLKLENNIILAGHINNVKELIYSSDLIVSSSLSEGLPFNIMEAMSLGIPILASNVKGNNDLIIDRYNGYLFNLDAILSDKDSFVSKIEHILNSNNGTIIENSLKSLDKYLLDNVFDYNISLLDI